MSPLTLNVPIFVLKNIFCRKMIWTWYDGHLVRFLYFSNTFVKKNSFSLTGQTNQTFLFISSLSASIRTVKFEKKYFTVEKRFLSLKFLKSVLEFYFFSKYLFVWYGMFSDTVASRMCPELFFPRIRKAKKIMKLLYYHWAGTDILRKKFITDFEYFQDKNWFWTAKPKFQCKKFQNSFSRQKLVRGDLDMFSKVYPTLTLYFVLHGWTKSFDKPYSARFYIILNVVFASLITEIWLKMTY